MKINNNFAASNDSTVNEYVRQIQETQNQLSTMKNEQSILQNKLSNLVDSCDVDSSSFVKQMDAKNKLITQLRSQIDASVNTLAQFQVTNQEYISKNDDLATKLLQEKNANTACDIEKKTLTTNIKAISDLLSSSQATQLQNEKDLLTCSRDIIGSVSYTKYTSEIEKV